MKVEEVVVKEALASQLIFNKTVYDIVVDVEVEKVVVKAAPASQLARTLASADTCPTCLGRDLCDEISSQFLTISLFAEKTQYGDVYKVCTIISSSRTQNRGLSNLRTPHEMP